MQNLNLIFSMGACRQKRRKTLAIFVTCEKRKKGKKKTYNRGLIVVRITPDMSQIFVVDEASIAIFNDAIFVSRISREEQQIISKFDSDDVDI